MRIAILASVLGARAGGVGRYTEELIREAAGDRDVATSVFAPASSHGTFALRARWEQEVLLGCDSDRFDILFGPAYAIPLDWHGRSVVTVHDLLFMDPTLQESYSREARAYYRHFAIASMRKASGLIAPSERVARDIRERFPEIAAPISVVRHGGEFNGQSGGAPVEMGLWARIGDRKVILYSGGANSRKRVDWLVDGYRRVPRNIRRGWCLVVVGLPQMSADDVIGTEALSDSALRQLYRRSSLVAYPSPSEGFGLPVVEGMTQGVPSIVSDTGASSELVGPGVLGVRMEHDMHSAWSAVLGDLLPNPEELEKLSKEAKLRASQFTWRASWDGTKAALQEAVAGGVS